MLRELDAVRQVAAHRAVDPISLEDLRNKSDQVGALVLAGHRVEPALYHRSSVLDEDGGLLLRNRLSPVTQQVVDGFQLAPALSNLQQFVRFLDWNEDGLLSVSDVAMALAALLPVDEEGVEHFVRDHFDVDSDGLIAEEALQEQMRPLCVERLAEFIEAAPVRAMPHLHREAGRSELLGWFDYWDTSDTNMLDLVDFRFALASSLYRTLGDAMDTATKETVSSIFLAEAAIGNTGQVSREEFVEVFAPSLKANMPSAEPACVEPDGELLVVAVHTPIEGQSTVVHLPAKEGVVAAIREEVANTWPGKGKLLLYVAGQVLLDDAPISEVLAWLRGGLVVQVLPELIGGTSSCTIA